MATGLEKNTSTGQLSAHFDATKVRDVHHLRPHPVTGRLIDSHPGKRTVPMKLLCLGMSRTGTVSLFQALQRLGYNPYHMVVAVSTPKTSMDCWREATAAKFTGAGPVWGRTEFDKMLGAYDAVLDAPMVLQYEELIKAYPEAKIVLTNRDLEAWLRSMDGTVGTAARFRGWNTLARWDDALVGPWWRMMKTVVEEAWLTKVVPGVRFEGVDSPVAKRYREHYEGVRRVAKREGMDLLEFRVQDGWGPLCDFLGVETPSEPFPNVNESSQFVAVMHQFWWMGVAKMVGKITLMAAVPAIGATAAWWWQSRR